MPQIRPIKDLRNTNEISEICHQSGEPVFITKNGYGDLVVMSMETYERQMARVEFYDKLAVAEAQIAEGNLLDADAAFGKLRVKICCTASSM